MPADVSLKIDVDTYLGTLRGVPRLLDTLGRLGVRATFFVSLGPDRSGLALRRVFRRGFLGKMWRTGAVRMYGARTLLYGTLLPAPLIAQRCAGVLRRIRDEGHEVGLHAWDHVAWHDGIVGASARQAAEWLRAGREAFRDVYGEWPDCHAAPAWRCTGASLAFADSVPLRYASDTRGGAPFFPRVTGQPFRTLQVPTTLPTPDEAWGLAGQGDALIDLYLRRFEAGGPQVLGAHAEGEGGILLEWFAALLKRAMDRGVRFRAVGDLAAEALADPGRVPVTDLTWVELPGRAGAVCSPEALPPCDLATVPAIATSDTCA